MSFMSTQSKCVSTYSVIFYVDLNNIVKKCRPRVQSSISTLIHKSKTRVDLIQFYLIPPSGKFLHNERFISIFLELEFKLFILKIKVIKFILKLFELPRAFKLFWIFLLFKNDIKALLQSAQKTSFLMKFIHRVIKYFCLPS